MTESKGGLFQRLKAGLSKTRESFVRQMDGLLSGRRIDDALLEELEDLMIMADFGVETSRVLLADARGRARADRVEDAPGLRRLLADAVRTRLDMGPGALVHHGERPRVVLVVGVNGVGKTTTIGKLAAHLRGEGQSVLLAAGDTFRAAAVEQLQVWGQRSGCAVVAQETGADAASVLYSAHQSARAQGLDWLIADTAGRLHTKVNLMEELKKIQRILAKQDPQAPHEVLLVLDATTGQNAINQARQFHESLGLTGLIVTKLDGTAKGGVVVGLAERFGLPIRYVGVGEGVEDLRPFDAAQFSQALFESR
ncbi:MAG: signal recognition particle-docking protein FtsY [Magnetococcus sp. WYHC-3]